MHQGVFNQTLRQESKQWDFLVHEAACVEATCADVQAKQHVRAASGDVGKSLLELARNSSKRVGSQTWQAAPSGPCKVVEALQCQGPHQTCMTTTVKPPTAWCCCFRAPHCNPAGDGPCYMVIKGFDLRHVTGTQAISQSQTNAVRQMPQDRSQNQTMLTA